VGIDHWNRLPGFPPLADTPSLSIEREVFVSVRGRFKNVLFEISSTDTSGVFEVNAKFMGVNMDKVDLLFQVTE